MTNLVTCKPSYTNLIDNVFLLNKSGKCIFFMNKITNNYNLEDSVSWSNVLFTIDIAIFWINVFICCTRTAAIMTFLKKLNYTSFSSIFEILSYTYSWMYDFTSKYKSFQKLNYRLTLFELRVINTQGRLIFHIST